MRGTILGLAAVFLGTPAYAGAWTPGVELWNGLVSGMSKADVLRRIPGAEPAKPVVKIVSGGQPGLTAHAPVSNHRTTDTFYFENDRLTDIIVAFDDLTLDSTSWNLTAYQELVDKLRLKYGQPFSCLDKSSTLVHITNRECDWRSGHLQINILYFDVDGRSPNISLSYHANGDAIAKDL